MDKDIRSDFSKAADKRIAENEKRKSQDEFMEEVVEAASLPAQTKKALGPESDEDRAMYTKEEIENMTPEEIESNNNIIEGLNKNDVVYTEGEKDGK